MSDPRPTVLTMTTHPWRTLRSLPHVDIVWHDGGKSGETQWHGDRVEIHMDRTMGQAKKRSVLVHELMHVMRGRPPIGEAAKRQEEHQVSVAAARLLIPLDALIKTLLWTTSNHEAADILWVDYYTYVTRINNLTEPEWAAIRAAFARIENAA